MAQRQITNHKSDNLLILIDSIRELSEIILKFRRSKYRRSESNKSNLDQRPHTVLIYAVQEPLRPSNRPSAVRAVLGNGLGRAGWHGAYSFSPRPRLGGL